MTDEDRYAMWESVFYMERKAFKYRQPLHGPAKYAFRYG
jgi:hypothetical protein